MRSKRQSLVKSQQITAADKIFQQILNAKILNTKQNIAIYLANDGEIDLTKIIKYLWQHNKNCYLPVLFEKQLKFALYTKDTDLKLNKYQIPEPNKQEFIAAEDLDLVFTPLVAFNDQLYRLGMGGGFYDRTFAFLNTKPRAEKPTLAGCAHKFQHSNEFEVNNWDVKLDIIFTN